MEELPPLPKGRGTACGGGIFPPPISPQQNIYFIKNLDNAEKTIYNFSKQLNFAVPEHFYAEITAAAIAAVSSSAIYVIIIIRQYLFPTYAYIHHNIR